MKSTKSTTIFLAQRAPYIGHPAREDSFKVAGCDCRFTEPLASNDRMAFFIPCERHASTYECEVRR